MTPNSRSSALWKYLVCGLQIPHSITLAMNLRPNAQIYNKTVSFTHLSPMAEHKVYALTKENLDLLQKSLGPVSANLTPYMDKNSINISTTG